MQNSLLIKGYKASQKLEAHQIVMFDSTTGIVPSQNQNSPVIGVTGELSSLSGTITDVIQVGIAEIILSGNVAAGVAVSPTAQGKAVTAGTTGRQIGIALKAGVVGDRIPILLQIAQIS